MKNRFFTFLLLSVILLLIIKGDDAISYGNEALLMCFHVIVPTLFPFLVCSGLLIYSGFCETLSKLFAPFMKPIFNINPAGSGAFILGIISGYPLGAVTACSLFDNSYISKSETERLLGFCNNSGPLFILGSVGMGIYSGLGIGLLLYITHIVSSLLVGIILRNYKKNDFSPPRGVINVRETNFGDILENSVKSILNICGAVMFFSVVSRLFIDLLPLNTAFKAILSGICEFATGVTKVSELDLSLWEKLAVSAFIIGFAGISVHIQVISVVSGRGLSLKPYIFGKFLQGVFSAVGVALYFAFSGKIKLSDFTFSKGFALAAPYTLSTAFLIVIIIVFCGIKFKNKITS